MVETNNFSEHSQVRMSAELAPKSAEERRIGAEGAETLYLPPLKVLP